MRIDKSLSGHFGSRTRAERAVKEGEVLVNGKEVSPSYELRTEDIVSFTQKRSCFVSVGGYKLEKALDDFSVDVTGKVFADVGASTGGFTDCLLQRGAAKVYCIDVGENQLDESLKDRNIEIIDNFNARDLTPSLFDTPLDGAVADVSFISLTYILDGIASALGSGKICLALIKPQFELDRKGVGKGGIVKDVALREKAIRRVYDKAVTVSLAPRSLTTAPDVRGKNREYMMLFEKDGIPTEFAAIKRWVTI